MHKTDNINGMSGARMSDTYEVVTADGRPPRTLRTFIGGCVALAAAEHFAADVAAAGRSVRVVDANTRRTVCTVEAVAP